MGLKYLLDTNILSEPVKPRPEQRVLQKLEDHAGEYCTAVTVWHELYYGAARLPDSKRKDSLLAYLSALEKNGLSVLPYEKSAGIWLAHERARLSKQGIAVSNADGEIAAVAATNNLVVVTRNQRDFSIFSSIKVKNWFDA